VAGMSIPAAFSDRFEIPATPIRLLSFEHGKVEANGFLCKKSSAASSPPKGALPGRQSKCTGASTWLPVLFAEGHVISTPMEILPLRYPEGVNECSSRSGLRGDEFGQGRAICGKSRRSIDQLHGWVPSERGCLNLVFFVFSIGRRPPMADQVLHRARRTQSCCGPGSRTKTETWPIAPNFTGPG